MPIIQSIVGSSYQFGTPLPPAITIGGAQPGVGNAAAGLLKRRYDQGYFYDDPTWFDGKTPDSSGADTTLHIETNADNYSIVWTGYFVVPTTGIYRFATTSDDSSFLWLGNNAVSGYTTSNAIVNNGGLHGNTWAYSPNYYQMTAGDYYPMRVMFGELSGGDTLDVYYELNASNNFINSNWATLTLYNSLTADGL
jgi:hypothetical protein